MTSVESLRAICRAVNKAVFALTSDLVVRPRRRPLQPDLRRNQLLPILLPSSTRLAVLHAVQRKR
jgi:hypothetical protein